MALITTIEQLRKYVKLSYNTKDFQSLPDMDLAEWMWLKPILGDTLYAALVATPGDAKYVTLLDYARAVVAPMAVYHNLPFVQAQITDNGLKTTSSETQQAAHRWEFKEVLNGLQDKAGFAAERLLEYLFADKAGENTLNWQNEAFENTIFKSGKDFALEYFIYQPHRTYILLLPVIREVEDHIISTKIGADFYAAFIASTPADDNAKLLMKYLRRAVANYTIAKAIESLSVKLTANGFTVKMGDDADDPHSSDKQAGMSFLNADTMLEAKRKNAVEAGNKYLLQAKDVLDVNASATVFPTYFSSSYYAAPSSTKTDFLDDNANRNGVFAF